MERREGELLDSDPADWPRFQVALVFFDRNFGCRPLSGFIPLGTAWPFPSAPVQGDPTTEQKEPAACSVKAKL